LVSVRSSLNVGADNGIGGCPAEGTSRHNDCNGNDRGADVDDHGAMISVADDQGHDRGWLRV
jgi:hypothetical protein